MKIMCTTSTLFIEVLISQNLRVVEIYTYAASSVTLANLASVEIIKRKSWLGGKFTKRLAP